MKKLLHKKLRIVILILTMVLVLTFLIGASLDKKAFDVVINGKTIGVIKDKQIVEQLFQEIVKETEDKFQKKVIISGEILFEEITISNKDKISTEGELKNAIKEQIKIEFEAYALNVNGDDLAYLDSEQDANEILNQLKEKYIINESNSEIKKIEFVEKVAIEKKAIPLYKIKKKDEIFEYINLGKDKVKTYIVQEGDTVWDISKKYELSLEEIMQANPGVDLDRIKIGQELIMVAPKPLINVKTIELIMYEETIPFPVEYEFSDSMYRGDFKVKAEGRDGNKKIYAELEKVNGIQTVKNIVSEEVIKEPEKEIVIKGLKERPKTMATGSFAMPARGRLTSSYGTRWGRKHEAIDVAMSVGTPIKAADGGKVIFSGTKGTYGKLVIIDHENGYETRYAHNSSLLVKQGDRVYKGQVIAESGNTGRSTGPHMHFEVRKDGNAIDPSKYVR